MPRTWRTINTDLRKKLSQNLRKRRAEDHFSVEEVAGRVPREELSSRQWQRAESGKSNVTLQTLSKLAAALDVDPLDLLR
jgi:transcriptional regulator with XRE-family HTH domain